MNSNSMTSFPSSISSGITAPSPDLTSSMKIDGTYITKVTLASLIAAFSLIGNSQEGVIGSMLVSPIGGSVVGITVATLLGDMVSLNKNSTHLILALMIMLGVGYVVGMQYEDQEPTDQMKARYNHPDNNTLLVAVIIGMCFGLAPLAKESPVGEMVGAGIAISLLPPIVNYGLTYANKTFKDDDIKKKSLMATQNIASYNMAGIAIACVLVRYVKEIIPGFSL